MDPIKITQELDENQNLQIELEVNDFEITLILINLTLRK